MNKELTKIPLNFKTTDEILTILGHQDKNLKIFEDYYQVQISLRGDQLYIFEGDAATIAAITNVFEALAKQYRRGQKITERDVLYAIKMDQEQRLEDLESLFDERYKIIKTAQGKTIYAKTINQKKYYDKIQTNDLVFGLGPAGTGKTYLAVIIGIAMLKKNMVRKIILTRPVVEAGENLGFLPGDLKEKVDPYLRPLYDALHDALGVEATEKMIERGVIEIAPLAYMRGRTLEDAYIILDEAQNTTKPQMKMFLTRLGFNSKMVITGDATQIDLPSSFKSGLKHAQEILANVKGIEFVHFETVDVVRHTLVQKIIEKYEQEELRA